MWGKFGQGLAAAASYTQQQGIAQRLAQDTADTAHMFNGIHEEHQLHLCFAGLIVVMHILLNHFYQLKNQTSSALFII